MKYIYLLLFIIVSNISYSQDTLEVDSVKVFYNSIISDSDLPKYDIFKIAYDGYLKYNSHVRNEKLIIVDFNLSSKSKRLWVIDIKERKLLYKTFVSHGIRSGNEYATQFSNTIGSKKTSLGFYITSETYNGSNGLSLKLDGLEDINSNIRVRRVVMHPANYVKILKRLGYLGRSEGCLAIPLTISQDIINSIKEGSIIFVYNDKYLPFHNSN